MNNTISNLNFERIDNEITSIIQDINNCVQIKNNELKLNTNDKAQNTIPKIDIETFVKNTK